LLAGEEKSFSLTLGELPKSREARATKPEPEGNGAGLPKLGMTVAQPKRLPEAGQMAWW
jgi:hypothetical protein